MTHTKPGLSEGVRLSLKVHDDDNVVTLLDMNTTCAQIADGTRIATGIPFGHKAALCDIATGAKVVKYGVVIGHAKCPITRGEHVHVHNVE